MKTKITLCLLMIGLLSGCAPTLEEAIIATKQSFSNPDFIGIVNGQNLYRVTIVYEGSFNYHYVYFLKDNPVITLNHDVPQGKTTIHAVEIFLNGNSVLKTNLTVKLEN